MTKLTVQKPESVLNKTDNRGNPTGGHYFSNGLEVDWQDGPLGRGEHRKEPNGAFVQDLIECVKQRVEFLNTAANGRFRCIENEQVVYFMEQALKALEDRHAERESRKVEGTHLK